MVMKGDVFGIHEISEGIRGRTRIDEPLIPAYAFGLLMM